MHLKSMRHQQISHYLLLVALIISIPASGRAQMHEVAETELSEVTAQAGISYVIGDSHFRITSNSYSFSDTDHTPYNWIELNNITVDDGNGNYFSMDTPANEGDFNTFDVGTDDSGLTHVFSNLSLNVEPRTYTVNNFVFCGQDLGVLRIENYRNTPSNTLNVAGRNDGTSGIDLEYQTEILIDSAKYIYNTSPQDLSLNGIHLSQTVTGDPKDPSLWTFSGKFKIGDWANDNPVTIDVATVNDTGGNPQTTSVFYNVPMAGSLRVQNVNFGGNNFGPCAIDGINVHHLGIQLPGN